MDMAALCKPYEGPDIPNGTLRTPARQRKWLVDRHRISEEVADLALSAVYARLVSGEAYPSGHDLDQAILAEAQRLTTQRHSAAVTVGQEQVEVHVASLYKQREAARRPRNLARHPITAAKWYKAQVAAFALGLLCGLSVLLWR